MITFFDPYSAYHKYPQGAIAAGASLRLRVVFPRDFGVRYVYLVISEDMKENIQIPLTWEQTDGYDESWITDISFDSPRLLFYHFEYENVWGRTVIKHSQDGTKGDIGETEKWQLTVYDKNLTTPDKIKGGIIYQIFPDRFFNSGLPKNNVPADRILRSDYEALPYWKPDSMGKIKNNDYFGGDFEGITQKLDRISEIGTNILYLNPISEAHSNHRYDTADYMRPDPLLGTEADFARLCEECKKRGISVIIDGVFSHTGDNSIYFNKYGNYGKGGAYSDVSSPYRKWYTFTPDGKYLCWWGIDTLPEVNEEDPDFIEFITGENGVINYWLSLGAEGYRLDVADELPDVFIDEVRKTLKKHSPDNYLLGEVWEDATNKISHGGRRRFLLGSQFDGVMNYPFRKSIIDFMLSGNAERFISEIRTITDNYPKQTLDVCMNHLGTHDTERILTVLCGINCDGMTRDKQAELTVSEETLEKGVRLLKTAMCINYTLPGIPSVYYGDEAGMTGGKDPFNRAYYPWGKENRDLLEFTKKLGQIRRNAKVLEKGVFCPVSSALSCVAYVRYSEDNSLPRLLTVANMTSEQITYWLPEDLKYMNCLIGGEKTDGGVIIPAYTAAILQDPMG